MKHLISILLFLASINTFAQNKRVDLPSSVNDTALFFKIERDKNVKLHLPDLSTSTDSIHIRFNIKDTIIDIRHNGYALLGFIASSPYREDKEVVNGDMFNTVQGSIQYLDPRTAQQIFGLFIGNKIAEIPSIKSWPGANSEPWCTIEYSTPTYYSFKLYVAPELFPDSKEAQTINTFMEQVKLLLSKRKKLMIGGMIDRIKR